MVNREAWLAARKELLAEEKALLRKLDAVSAKRRALPWVRVEQDYRFQGSVGRFNVRMESRDGSAGFDFEGTYTEVILHQKIAYSMDDNREVVIAFEPEGTGTRITETFDAESENSLEMQKAGWQSILENFQNYVEAGEG